MTIPHPKNTRLIFDQFQFNGDETSSFIVSLDNNRGYPQQKLRKIFSNSIMNLDYYYLSHLLITSENLFNIQIAIIAVVLVSGHKFYSSAIYLGIDSQFRQCCLVFTLGI